MSIVSTCQGHCGRRGNFLHGFCSECIQKFCKRCGKKMEEMTDPLFCPSCIETRGTEQQNVVSDSIPEKMHIFDPVILGLRRQLRQLEEEKSELVYTKQRGAVTLQITLINQKMRDLRNKIKVRQAGESQLECKR